MGTEKAKFEEVGVHDACQSLACAAGFEHFFLTGDGNVLKARKLAGQGGVGGNDRAVASDYRAIRSWGIAPGTLREETDLAKPSLANIMHLLEAVSKLDVILSEAKNLA